MAAVGILIGGLTEVARLRSEQERADELYEQTRSLAPDMFARDVTPKLELTGKQLLLTGKTEGIRDEN